MTAKKPRALNKKPTSGNPKVGYGRPPAEHRFKAGQSGNPKGRPKGKKNPDKMLRELLDRKISIRESGQVKRITFLEAMFLRFAEDALRGNVKSAAFLLSRYQNDDRASDGSSALTPDDQKIIHEYMKEFTKKGLSK